jgi:hypothetical protein
MTPASQLFEFSNQTVLSSLRRTEEILQVQPEDLRTRRYGYNPGWSEMRMHPRQSGLQTGRVDAGSLIVFETTPMKVPNLSVDPSDPDQRRALDGELLAGEQVRNLLSWYEPHGFKEFESIRGVNYDVARSLFRQVHPPLELATENGLIQPCLYAIDNTVEYFDQHGAVIGRAIVCVTCRKAVLDQFNSTDEQLVKLARELRASVTTAIRHMTNYWGSWVSELSARVNNAAGDKGAIAVLEPGHLAIMRQLHQRTPSDAELAKINSANMAMKDGIAQIGKEIAAAVTANQSDRVAALEAKMADQQAEFLRTLEAMQKQIAQSNKPKAEKKETPKE